MYIMPNNVYKNKNMMNLQLKKSHFCQVNLQRAYQLEKQVSEASCEVYEVSNQIPFNKDNHSKKIVQISLKGSFVIAKNIISNQIVACFCCDYDIKFQVKRSHGKVNNALGKPQFITFQYFINENETIDIGNQLGNKNQNKIVFMVLENNLKKFQEFVKELQKKYIVQKGFHNSFKAIKRIGKGVTACVYSAKDFVRNQEVAIKSFKRSTYFASDNNKGKLAFKKEFQIMTKLDHKNISKLIGVYETDNSIYMIMELLSMSLFAYLQKYGFPSSEIIQQIMFRLLEGLNFMHQKGIMHRDLKLQNIMVRNDSKINVQPVIVDVGLAEFTQSQQYLYTKCGTPGYVAPQVLKIKSDDINKTYTEKCDIFSLGVIFHILLLEKSVFEGSEIKDVIKRNSQCDIKFDNQKLQKYGSKCKDLLIKMLSKNPKDRISASQALEHSYFESYRQVKEIYTPTLTYCESQSMIKY